MFELKFMGFFTLQIDRLPSRFQLFLILAAEIGGRRRPLEAIEAKAVIACDVKGCAALASMASEASSDSGMSEKFCIMSYIT